MYDMNNDSPNPLFFQTLSLFSEGFCFGTGMFPILLTAMCQGDVQS